MKTFKQHFNESKNHEPKMVEGADGSKEWWINGKRHRDGGLPAIEGADGSKHWYVNGELHRDGGLPAIEWADGTKAWFLNGKLHRDGGLPAIEGADGSKEWFLNGKEYTHNDYFKKLYKTGKISYEDYVLEVL